MSTSSPATTIQITRTNVALLDEVGAVLQQQFPHLWGDQKPSRNTIVGYLANEFLSAEGNPAGALTPLSEPVRGAAAVAPGEREESTSPGRQHRQVYALRGTNGKLRGTWHDPSYHECPGRAAFKVQHPDDHYSLVDLDEVGRRLKQCAFCFRYERGEL